MKANKLTQNAYNQFVTNITQTSSQAVTSIKPPTSKSPQSKISGGDPNRKSSLAAKKFYVSTKLTSSVNVTQNEIISENMNMLKYMTKNASVKDIKRINSAKKDIDHLKSQKLPPQTTLNPST